MNNLKNRVRNSVNRFIQFLGMFSLAIIIGFVLDLGTPLMSINIAILTGLALVTTLFAIFVGPPIFVRGKLGFRSDVIVHARLYIAFTWQFLFAACAIHRAAQNQRGILSAFQLHHVEFATASAYGAFIVCIFLIIIYVASYLFSQQNADHSKIDNKE